MGSQASTAVLGALGVAALAVFVPGLWRWTRAFSTFVHESGHAFANLLVGRTVEAVEIFLRGGGCTSSDGPDDLRRVVTGAAGYSAPPAAGLGLVAALDRGVPAPRVLAVVLFLVVVILVLAANVFGIVVVLVVVAGLAVLIHIAGPLSQATAVILAAWFLLLAGARDNVELFAISRQGLDDDASKLAARTGIPTVVWVSAFAGFAAYAIYQAGRWLLVTPEGILPDAAVDSAVTLMAAWGLPV